MFSNRGCGAGDEWCPSRGGRWCLCTNPTRPERSALYFADGVLTANDVLALSWPAPPYFVFNSACESGRAAGGRRLLSRRSQSNGLAAAFLAAGVAAYAGYFWPVTEVGAGKVRELYTVDDGGTERHPKRQGGKEDLPYDITFIVER